MDSGIGNRLRDLRNSRGFTHDDVAKKIGVDRTTSVKWETGGSKPTRYLKKLADLYDVSIDYIVNGHDNNNELPPDLFDFLRYEKYRIGDREVRPEERVKIFSALSGIISALELPQPKE